MRVGTLYQVEKYLVVQKITRLKVNLYLNTSTTQTKIFYNLKTIKKRKSVCQIIMKIDSLVTGCPWHERTPSSIVFLRKTSKESNPELVRKIKESRVVRE
jgi:hypothetical protein